MNVNTKTKCPLCGGRGEPVKGGVLKCKRGCGAYDGKPDEHGRALHNDPERNAEIMEREQGRSR